MDYVHRTMINAVNSTMIPSGGEIRVAFLGDKGAGKGLTIQRLCNPDLDPDYFVGGFYNGIRIMDHDQKIDGKPVRVHYWSFGGEELLHPFHRIFLTERTVYVVMLNARNSSLDARARYWLHTIRSFAGEAPVLVVLNHIDEMPYASISVRELKRAYPQIIDVTRCSASSFSKEDFREAVTRHLEKAILAHCIRWDRLPDSWKTVRFRFTQTSLTHLSVKEYEELCAKAGVTEGREELLRTLRDLGICVASGVGADQDDGRIFGSDWLIRSIYPLVQFGGRYAGDGGISQVAARNCIRSYYGQGSYRPEDIGHILAVLRRSRLSFSLPSGREFIPALCKKEPALETKTFEEDPNILESVLTYDYLPDGVLHRLMVDLRRDLVREYARYSSALFRQKSTDVSAVVECREQTIRIYVDGGPDPQEASSYLSRIRAALEAIIRDMGLTQPETTVVYKAEGKQENFHFEMLLGAMQHGEDQVYSRNFRRILSIPEILKRSDWEPTLKKKDLVSHIAKSCSHVLDQSPRSFADASGWCGLLGTRLAHWGYRVIPRLTKAGLLLLNDADQPWTFIESMDLAEGEAGAAAWRQHLSALLTDGGMKDMEILFHVCCCRCASDAMERLCGEYAAELARFAPPGHEPMERSLQRVDTVSDPGEGLAVYQNIYYRSGTPVTVYHCFVRTGDPVRPEEERPQPVEMRPRSAEEPSAEFCKVVFLGDGEAGKSLTLARLMKPDLDPETFTGDMTPGINIREKDYRIGKRQLHVGYWDFGGQEILYSMHRMFLTDHTLYVVLLNTRQDTQDERARFWLRFLRAYAAHSPVLLVLNKLDHNPRASVNRGQLHRINPMLKQILHLSALKYNWEEFQEALEKPILEQISRMDLENPTYTFTDRELRIRDKLSALQKDKLITFSEFQNICEDEGLEEDDQNSLLYRFNKVGIFVHFHKSIHTDGHMLPEPKWITGAIYRILAMRHDRDCAGLLPHSEIRKTFHKDHTCPCAPENLPYVLAVMRSHYLSYELTKDRAEFLPMLCGREESAAAEELARDPDAVRMHLLFDYLPAGVLFQLIVENYKVLEQENVWLTGAVFRDRDGNRALVTKDGDTLSIYVKGYSPGEAMQYLEDLKKQIEDIAEDPMHAAVIRERKLGFRVRGEVEYFDYEWLRSISRSKAQHPVFSGLLQRFISVRHILSPMKDGIGPEDHVLLEDIADLCLQIQADPVGIKPDEDSRNRRIREGIRNKGYTGEDQTQIGAGKSGNRPNELDILLHHKDNNHPWMILEALNVSERSSAGNWDEHINKLRGRYNVWGLYTTVLISYVDCEEEEFDKLYKKYEKRMKEYHSRDFTIVEGSYEPYQPFHDEMALFRGARCEYRKAGTPMKVYHYFFRAGGKKPNPPKDAKTGG